MPRSDGYFLPGHPGGPGRPPLPDDIREAAKNLRTVFIQAVVKLWPMPPNELKEYLMRPDTPSSEVQIGTLIAKGMELGCPKRLELILLRTIGRVPFQLTDDPNHNPKQITQSDVIELLKQIAEESDK